MTIAKIYKSLEIGTSTITKEKNLDFQEALVVCKKKSQPKDGPYFQATKEGE
jgi:hypothetical protein